MLDQAQLCRTIWKLLFQYTVELIHEYSKFFDSFCCYCYMVIVLSCYKGLLVEAFKVVITTSCFDCSSK